jgi:hypothetical protein
MSLAIGLAEALRSGKQAYQMRADHDREMEAKQDRAADREVRQGQLAEQRRQQARQQSFETDMSNASAPIVQEGTVVDTGQGKLFARDASTGQKLAEDAQAFADMQGSSAQVAQGAAANGKIYSSPQEARVAAGPDGPSQTMQRQSSVLLKHGKPVEAMQLSKMAKEAQKEGDVEALEEIIRTRDVAKASALFNSKGSDQATDVRIVEDPNQKSKAYGTPALKIFGKLNGSDQEVDLLQGSNAVDYLLLLKGGITALMDSERAAKSDARAESGHNANLNHLKFNEDMATKKFGADRDDRKDDKSFRDQKFDWEKSNDLFSRKIQSANLGINQAQLGLSAQRFNLEKQHVEDSRKAAAAGGLDLKKLDPQLNRIGDIVGAATKVDETLPEAERAAANNKAAGLKVRAQQVYLGAAMGGSSITPEMAVDAALNGKYGQMPVQNSNGEKGLRPFIEYQGGKIYLSHAPVSAMPVAAQQAARVASPANTQANPQASMWQQSVDGIQAQQRQLAAQMPSMNPTDQAKANQQLMDLSKIMQGNIEKARAQGVVVQ